MAEQKTKLSKENKLDFKTVLTVFILLLNSGYYRSTATDSYMPLILLIAVTLLYLPPIQTIRFWSNKYVIVLGIGIFLSTVANFNVNNLLSGGRVLMTMLCVFILCKRLTLEKFSGALSFLMRWMIVLSVLLYGLSLLGLTGSLPVLHQNSRYYYDLFVVTQSASVSANSGRVMGMFWEPGVFASAISVTMLFEYYLAGKKINPLGMALYLVGIALSLSTAGFMIIFFIILGLLWRRFAPGKFRVSTVIFVIVVILLAIFYEDVFAWLAETMPRVFGKLLRTTSGTTSTRMNCPTVNMEVFWKRPMFGWGFTDSSTQIARHMGMSNVRVVAQTSTSTQILAAIGVFGAAYSLAFVTPIFSANRLQYLGIEMRVILAVCGLLIVNKEPHVFNALTWMLLLTISTHPDPKEKAIGDGSHLAMMRKRIRK